MIRIAYLMEITTISDQKINDTIPSTAAGETTPPKLAAFAASLNAYKGLVPMSPKTIPMHASVAGAHAREVSGIRFRANAVIGVPSVSISKVYVKRSFAQYKCVGEQNCYTSERIRHGEAFFRVV